MIIPEERAFHHRLRPSFPLDRPACSIPQLLFACFREPLRITSFLPPNVSSILGFSMLRDVSFPQFFFSRTFVGRMEAVSFLPRRRPRLDNSRMIVAAAFKLSFSRGRSDAHLKNDVSFLRPQMHIFAAGRAWFTRLEQSDFVFPECGGSYPCSPLCFRAIYLSSLRVFGVFLSLPSMKTWQRFPA